MLFMTLKNHKQVSAFQPDNPCSKCGSTHVGHRGNRWYCFGCGKSWMKEYVDTRVFRKDVPCSECGSIHVRSHSVDWVCVDCGHSWVKNRVKRQLKKEELEPLKDKSQHEIAQILGVSQSAVSMAMKRFGIQANPQYVWVNRGDKQKEINQKISVALKGNINWRFNNEYPNKEEQKIIHFFKKWNLPFEYVGDGSFKIDGKCPDFVWKDKKIIVEFFGDLWHEPKEEELRIKFFKERGWDCFIIWGHDASGRVREAYSLQWEHKLYDRIIRWLAGLS